MTRVNRVQRPASGTIFSLLANFTESGHIDFAIIVGKSMRCSLWQVKCILSAEGNLSPRRLP